MWAILAILLLAADAASVKRTHEVWSELHLSYLDQSKPKKSPPDPKCILGLPSADKQVCCPPVCWTCGPHTMCNNNTKYREATGQNNTDCCAPIILKKNGPCEKGGSPCRLSAKYRADYRKELELPITAARHKRNRAIVKQREFRFKLYNKVKANYDFAMDLARDVQRLTSAKIEIAKMKIRKFKAKIAGLSTKFLKVAAGAIASGPMDKMKRYMWQARVDNNADEARFYGQILNNSLTILKYGRIGLETIDVMKVKIQTDIDRIEHYGKEVERLNNDSKVRYKQAKVLWKQWLMSSMTLNCTWKPSVLNSKSTCLYPNTKVRVCPVVCLAGYDGPESLNTLRCLKQGDFDKELYGEISGLATCVGRNCGSPPNISKATTIIQDIIYPNAAAYSCAEGHSSTGRADGLKVFDVKCGVKGKFDFDKSKHVCKPIICGKAPAVANSFAVAGLFKYTDIVEIKCLTGHTIDATAGGLKKFVVTCQASGKFTQAQKCRPVMCGSAPVYDTSTPVYKGDKFYGDEMKYTCKPGHTIDQKPTGISSYTLRCIETGEFSVVGRPGVALPKCRPMSAGMAPVVKYGRFEAREMFFGESEVIVAKTGYMTADKKTSFILTVTAEGKFSGLKEFLPIACSTAPKIRNSVTEFSKPKAVFGDLLKYTCLPGYSIDATEAPAMSSFTITCEADATFSKIPGKGECVDIDDCARHSCGPHGRCVDELKDYKCVCARGYKEVYDEKMKEKTCGNIDDCGPEACGKHGDCEDLVDDYLCNCDAGYHQVSDGEGHTCVPVSCGVPPKVANALTEPVEEAGTKMFFNKSLLYQCNTGYTLDGKFGSKNHFTTRCKYDKSFEEVKECKPIECGAAPKVAHAELSSATATFNESVKYTCEYGYTIDGLATGNKTFGIICQATGVFGLPLSCKKITCGEPDEVANAARKDGTRYQGDEVKYKCFSGFLADDGKSEFVSDCQVSGKFTPPSSCKPKICGNPPEKIHVLHATVPDMGRVYFPQVVEVTCRDGYTIGGDPKGNTSFVVRCGSDGKFERYDKRECKAVKCGSVLGLSIPNASLREMVDASGKVVGRPDGFIKTTMSYGMKATYSCLAGFTAGGEPDAPSTVMAQCYPSGAFSLPSADLMCRNVNDCDKYTCGPHGTCIDLIGKSPAYTCKCQHGYDLRTKPDGTKFCGDTDDCGKRGCGPGVCKDLVGDYTCICPSGHYVGKKDGEKTCLPVRCLDKLPAVANAELLKKHTGPVEFPTTLRYKCKMGHSVDGSAVEAKSTFQASCKAHGALHGLMSCQPIQCGTPHVLPFTKLLFPKKKSDPLRFGQVAKYDCADGYTVRGKPGGTTNFTIACKPSGVIADPEVCEPIQCGRAPRMPKCRAGIAGKVSYGMSVRYQCDAGHSVDGTATGKNFFIRKCLRSGKFEDPPSDKPCKPICAGKLPVVKQAHPISYAGEFLGNEMPGGSSPLEQLACYGKGIDYECDWGYSLNGGKSGATMFFTKVNGLGKFFPAIPTACKPILYTVAGEIKDARSGKSLEGATISFDGGLPTATRAGFFTLEEVKPGPIRLKYEKEGFITTYKNILVGEDIHHGGVADINMSPTLGPKEWRAAVKWAAEPLDLDVYAKWGMSKVFWSTPYGRESSVEGKLEKDDTDGFGPETLLFSNLGNCSGTARKCDIRYMINDYSGMGDLQYSRAEVTLYNADRQIGTWTFDQCKEAGKKSKLGPSITEDNNWWHVFTIDAKKNELKWHCGSEDSLASDEDMWLLKLPSNATAEPRDPEDYGGPFPGRFWGRSKKRTLGKFFAPGAAGKKNPRLRTSAKPAEVGTMEKGGPRLRAKPSQ